MCFLDDILEGAEEKDVVFLVVGDPFGYLLHYIVLICFLFSGILICPSFVTIFNGCL